MRPIFYTFFALLFFTTCRKDEPRCEEMTTTYNYLTATSLERTRYFTDPAFDTVKFKSNSGDTLIFVKTDCDSTWFDEFKSYGNPACGPYENVKNLQITNTYKTIKGEGLFKVKHSVKIDPYHDYVIEIDFLNYHFYFDEINFNRITFALYHGDYAIDSIIFKDVFYGYPNYSNTEVKGFLAPRQGLIAVEEITKGLSYQIIK